MFFKTSLGWKVPLRESYTFSFRQWIGETLLCHVYYRICPPPVPMNGPA